MAVELAVDRAVASLAASQGGQITRAQLVACGMSHSGLRARLARGYLVRLRRGVFALAGATALPWAAERSALLAAGDGAWLRARSACARWGIAPAPPPGAPVQILVVDGCPRAREGIDLRRAGELHRHDRRVLDGLRLTAPARAILDLAGEIDATALAVAEAIDVARGRGLVSTRILRGAIDRAPARRGVALLNRLLSEDCHGFTRSEAERRMRALCRDAGLDQPPANQVLLGRERDFVWPTERVVVEVDGFATHGGRDAFERDRARDRALIAAGWVVLRVTWRALTTRPLEVAAQLAAALAVRQAA